MARSKIIQDLANGTVDTMTALKRAKVLFSELKSDTLSNWINSEIAGYPDKSYLPDYRIIRGNLKGTYMIGTMSSGMKYQNASIPLKNMPSDLIKDVLEIKLYDGVNALRQLCEQSTTAPGGLVKEIPADCFPVIAKYSGVPFITIGSAYVSFSSHYIQNIFSVVESRLLDSLILLEKEFGNLDDLDIDVSSKAEEDIQQIVNQIIVIIYNDNSVSVGDNNKIKNSSIASSIDN